MSLDVSRQVTATGLNPIDLCVFEMIHMVRGPGETYNWVRKRSADLGFV